MGETNTNNLDVEHCSHRNIYFIGLMGAGKTTIGKQLAKQLNKQFYDTDHEIEKRTGVKIPVIFELEGESGFRRRELSAIEELTQLNDVILATGGGAIMNENSRKLLQDNGLVIYLRANVNELCNRTRNDKHRPLLQNVDVREKLKELYEIRNPLYEKTAHHIVDTGNQPVQHIIHKIEKILSQSQTTSNNQPTND